MPIENKNRSAEEDASLAVAEESRQTEWTSKSLMREMFLEILMYLCVIHFLSKIQPMQKLAMTIVPKLMSGARKNIDGEEIDRTETIPAHVWRGMKRLNLLGYQDPKGVWWVGMSQQNYMRILSVIARYCGSVAQPSLRTNHWCSTTHQVSR